MIKTARKGWSNQLITVICTEEDVWLPGSGKAVTVVPVRIIFWTLFSVISAVTIYIFLSVMSGGVHTPFALQNSLLEKHIFWIPSVVVMQKNVIMSVLLIQAWDVTHSQNFYFVFPLPLISRCRWTGTICGGNKRVQEVAGHSNWQLTFFLFRLLCGATSLVV